MSNTNQESKRLYSCIMHDFHDGKDRQENWEREIQLVINSEVTAVLDEANNTIKELQTYLLSENSTEKLVELQDAIKAIQSIKERYNGNK